jgi:hypothetical protein
VQVTVANAGIAVTLYVNNTLGNSVSGCTTSGSGACETVQQGIIAAETYSNSDVTVMVAAGTYNEHDTINVPGTDTLIIRGAGTAATTLNATQGGAVITIDTGTVTVNGLTITGGQSTEGAGVTNSGSLTMTNDTVAGNSAGDGSGIYNSGTLTMTDDTLFSNSAGGNGGNGDGGGVYNSGTLTMTNDTLSGNSASQGGAVYNHYGTLIMTNDTFSGNSAAGTGGGGVYSVPNASPVYSFNGTLISGVTLTTISNSVFSNSSCFGNIVDGGYNVESDNTCGFGSTDTLNSSTINLASTLAANGSSGPQTIAIGTNSSAYKEVPTANCTLTVDERGDARPGIPGQYCDAGAFEYQAIATTTTTTTSTTTLPPSSTTTTTFPLNSTLSVSASGGSLTFTATVKNAKTCAWSSSPAIAGFAATVQCKTGKVTRSARIPANTSTTAKSYSITLTLRGTSSAISPDYWLVNQAGKTTPTTTTTTTTTVPELSFSFPIGNNVVMKVGTKYTWNLCAPMPANAQFCGGSYTPTNPSGGDTNATYSFSLQSASGLGLLPPGLSLNGFTGDISGTPALGDDTMTYENGSPAGTASFGICVSTTSIQRGQLSQCFGPATIKVTPTTSTTNSTTTTTTTSTSGTSPYCVQTNDGSSGGWNYYKYVDSTSTAPCYAHWNITLGPGCEFFLNGAGPYSAPGNIWNIVYWGNDGSDVIAYLNDGHTLEYTCTTNLSRYPQTSLNSTNWS